MKTTVPTAADPTAPPAPLAFCCNEEHIFLWLFKAVNSRQFFSRIISYYGCKDQEQNWSMIVSSVNVDAWEVIFFLDQILAISWLEPCVCKTVVSHKKRFQTPWVSAHDNTVFMRWDEAWTRVSKRCVRIYDILTYDIDVEINLVWHKKFKFVIWASISFANIFESA